MYFLIFFFMFLMYIVFFYFSYLFFRRKLPTEATLFLWTMFVGSGTLCIPGMTRTMLIIHIKCPSVLSLCTIFKHGIHGCRKVLNHSQKHKQSKSPLVIKLPHVSRAKVRTKERKSTLFIAPDRSEQCGRVVAELTVRFQPGILL